MSKQMIAAGSALVAVAAMGSEIEGPVQYPALEATEMMNETTQATETETSDTVEATMNQIQASDATETKKTRAPRKPRALKAEAAPKKEKAAKAPREPKAPRAPRKPKAVAVAEAVMAATDPAPKAPRAKKEKAPKLHAGGVDNGYPFLSKKQIVAKIAEDAGFATQCLLILDGRQTEDEREEGDTIYKNRRGWQSSHAKRGSGLAAKLQDTGLESSEVAEVQELVSLYRKQLSAHFRQVAIDSDPALAQKAAAFFTPQPTAAV
jgi:hypothetical protein